MELGPQTYSFESDTIAASVRKSVNRYMQRVNPKSRFAEVNPINLTGPGSYDLDPVVKK